MRLERTIKLDVRSDEYDVNEIGERAAFVMAYQYVTNDMSKRRFQHRQDLVKVRWFGDNPSRLKL